jgi:hypothetical protein
LGLADFRVQLYEATEKWLQQCDLIIEALAD